MAVAWRLVGTEGGVVSGGLKVTLIVILLLIVTVQVFPDVVDPQFVHAVVYPEFGVAVSVTWVPLFTTILQVDPQLMPAGLLVTDPPPPFMRVRVEVEEPPEADLKAAMLATVLVIPNVHDHVVLTEFVLGSKR